MGSDSEEENILSLGTRLLVKLDEHHLQFQNRMRPGEFYKDIKRATEMFLVERHYNLATTMEMTHCALHWMVRARQAEEKLEKLE